MKPETLLKLTLDESLGNDAVNIARTRYDEWMKVYGEIEDNYGDQRETVGVLKDLLDKAMKLYIDRHTPKDSDGLSHDEYYYEWLEEVKAKENATLDSSLPLGNELDRAYVNEYFSISEIAYIQCGLNQLIKVGAPYQKTDDEREIARRAFHSELYEGWDSAMGYYRRIEDNKLVPPRMEKCREMMRQTGEFWYAKAQEYMASGEWSELAIPLMCAAENEHLDGMIDYALAQIYGQYGIYRDTDEGVSLLRRAAELGSGRAAYLICELYDDGLFEIEGEEALRMCQKAAELGERRAEERLTRSFDTRPLTEILEERIENGDNDSMWQLYLYYAYYKKHNEANKWLDKCVEIGHPEALVEKAERCAYQNYPLALQYLRRAAEKGNVRAITWLGESELCEDDDRFWKAAMKLERHGRPDADTEGRHSREFGWYKLAAEAGDTEAMTYMRYAYYYGYPVEQNYDTAFMWAQRAAEEDNITGVYLVAQHLEEGLGTKKDLHRALELYEHSSERGSFRATYRLYEIYRDGLDEIAPDKDKASHFLRLSGVDRD